MNNNNNNNNNNKRFFLSTTSSRFERGVRAVVSQKFCLVVYVVVYVVALLLLFFSETIFWSTEKREDIYCDKNKGLEKEFILFTFEGSLCRRSFVRSFVRKQTNKKNAQVDWWFAQQESGRRTIVTRWRWWLLRCPVVEIIIHCGNCEIGKASRRHLGRQKQRVQRRRRRDMRSKVSRARRLGPDAVGRAETLVQIEKHRDARRRRRQRNETRANVLANARRSAVLRVYRVLVREECIIIIIIIIIIAAR